MGKLNLRNGGNYIYERSSSEIRQKYQNCRRNMASGYFALLQFYFTVTDGVIIRGIRCSGMLFRPVAMSSGVIQTSFENVIL